MIGATVLTLLVFMVAIAVCIAINFVVCRYAWLSMPDWAREIVFICCVTIVMFVLYHIVGHMWGIDVFYNEIKGLYGK